MNKKNVAIFVLLLISVTISGIYLSSQKMSVKQQEPSKIIAKDEQDPDQARAISVKPEPNSTLLPVQPIEITFNYQLTNIPDFKYRIEPEFKHTMTLSEDKKTLTITPDISYPLGGGFTLYILPGTKFEVDKKLPGDLMYRFETIEYRGI